MEHMEQRLKGGATMKAKEVQRFILVYKYYEDDGEEVYEVSEKVYAKKEVDKLIGELTKLGREYEEWNNECIAGVLLSPNGERIYIVRAGRTVKEVIKEVWNWLRKNKDKKIRIFSPDFAEDEDSWMYGFLQLFQIVDKDENGYVGYFKGKKKQLAELVEKFVWYFAPVEFCFYEPYYLEGWGLKIEEKVVYLWNEINQDGLETKCYLKLEVLG